MAFRQVFSCTKSLEQCIYEFLDSNQFTFRYIKPDGDCFFNSLIQSGVFSRKTTVQGLRYALVKYLKTTPDIMETLQRAGISGNVNELKKPRAWAINAGDLVPQYASRVFGIHLKIYDVRKDNETVLINEISFPHENAGAPIVRMLRTGNNHYSLLLPPQPSNSNMLNKSTVNLLHMAPNLPNPSARAMRAPPSNTGTSTVKGYQSALPETEHLFNVEVKSHPQLALVLKEMLEKTELERDMAIMEHTAKSAWYKNIQKMMTNRAPKEPHLTLLELCKKYPIHRCLRAIHHYFGAFMDHSHDWKNITECVLSDNLEVETEKLKIMVKGLPIKDARKLNAWITTWKEKVLQIRTGTGVSQKRCREYLNILNEEYVRFVNDPEIMSGEPLAYWLPANFEHTIQQTWEFSEEERADVMAEMKTYLISLGIRAMYFESGANWMDEIMEKQGDGKFTLNQIRSTDDIVALGLWPHAAYNAAPCGVTLCSAKAGPCTKTCSIPIQIDGMEILGARIDVIVKRNIGQVKLDGVSDEHAHALVKEGGILIRKDGHYILLLGDPVELSLNALSKTIEDSIGVYRRGDVNNSGITNLHFIYSANIPTGLRDEMATTLKTWTDAVQLRGVSALKWYIEKGGKIVYIVFVTLDYMCLESALTEDVPFVLLSSSIRSSKDEPTDENALIDTPTRHRYTLHCFDNTVVKANREEIFKNKANTFAWICQKAVTGELDSMLDALLENKEQQMRLVADSVADPTLFFACHQMIESVGIHKEKAHARCDQIKSLVTRMKNPNDDTKQAVESTIEMGPLKPSATLEHFASLSALSEKFDRSVEKLHETRDAVYDAVTPMLFLDSYTAARQDVRNSGITNNEHEIELYAVCMMVMEYIRTGHIAAIETLITIQTKALKSVRKTYEDWLYEEYPRNNNARRALQVEPIDFITAWTARGNIREKTMNILQQIHQPGSMKIIDKRGEITKVSTGTTYETGILGFKKVIEENMDVKNIMKASTMCLYLINEMTKPTSELSFRKLNETYNANVNMKDKKSAAAELANSGKLQQFTGYPEQLKEQMRSFTLRMVGVPFASFVEACLEDPNLYCKDCPKEKECVVCTATSCRVVGHSSSYSNAYPSAKRHKSRPAPSNANASAAAAPNATASAATQRAAMTNVVPLAPPPPAPLDRSESGSKRKRNQLTIGPSNLRKLAQQAASASAAAAMNTNNKGGTRKRARKTRVKRQRKRQTRNRKAQKTRKN